MTEQLVLDLPHRPALGADDFLVSACNAAAVRLIDDWPRWPAPMLTLVGPEGSGKSHLANVWRLKTGAGTVAPADLRHLIREVRDGVGALVLEDLDRGAWDERELFHCFNRCREAGISVLATARTPPSRIAAALPDLASRLRSLPSVAIEAPDDALLRAVLLKQFADRQIDVEPRVIAFLAPRMERSMDFARTLVAELDRAGLATQRRITRRLAADVLARLLPATGE